MKAKKYIDPNRVSPAFSAFGETGLWLKSIGPSYEWYENADFHIVWEEIIGSWWKFPKWKFSPLMVYDKILDLRESGTR